MSQVRSLDERHEPIGGLVSAFLASSLPTCIVVEVIAKLSPLLSSMPPSRPKPNETVDFPSTLGVVYITGGSPGGSFVSRVKRRVYYSPRNPRTQRYDKINLE